MYKISLVTKKSSDFSLFSNKKLILSNNMFDLSCLRKRVKCYDYVGFLVNELMRILCKYHLLTFKLVFKLVSYRLLSNRPRISI